MSDLDWLSNLNNYKFVYSIAVILICLSFLFSYYTSRFKAEYKVPLIANISQETNSIQVYLGEGFLNPGFYVFKGGTTLGSTLSQVENTITPNSSIDLSRVLLDGDVLSFSTLSNNSNTKSITEADYESLLSVNGIGEKTAKLILKYIAESKPENVEELISIPGVGVKTIEELKKYYF